MLIGSPLKACGNDNKIGNYYFVVPAESPALLLLKYKYRAYSKRGLSGRINDYFVPASESN